MLNVNFYDFDSIRALDMPDLKVTSIECARNVRLSVSESRHC
jgi:hypothetical protein